MRAGSATPPAGNPAVIERSFAAAQDINDD
jgi:hypothetical protein